MSQAVVPEISLDTAAAAAIPTTTSNRLTTSGTEAKYTLRPPLIESTGHSEDSSDIYSRLRRPLRNIPPTRSDSTMFNPSRSQSHSRLASKSAYPTPDRSDTSKDLKTNIRGNGRKLHTKPSISKLVSPSPSASLHSPIIYDTIEVMLAPPPEFLAEEPNLAKRKTLKSVGRRSKRRRLDTEDGRSSFEWDETVANDAAHRLDVADGPGETEPIGVTGTKDTGSEEVQIEPFLPLGSDVSQESGEENQNQETPSAIVVVDITPAPSPNQIKTQPEEYISTIPTDAELPKLSLPSTPEPIDDSISLPASIAKLNQPEDIDDWLMTDIDQSVDDEPITRSDPMMEDVYGRDDTEDNEKSEHADRETALDPVASNEMYFPLERDASPESPATVDATDDLMDRIHEDTRDQSVMELDVELHDDSLDKATFDCDPITTVIDEVRMSLSGSVIESPSPPLRTILPKLALRRPFSAGTSKSSPSKESFQPNESESGETSDDFVRQQPSIPDLSTSKQSSISPYPKFDSKNMRSRRSARRANELAVELRKRPIRMELPLSTYQSGASTLSSPVSLPTPPAGSPPPITRAGSPSFGLRTTPRPIARPPIYPARGGLRFVNHDADVRAKLLMARPKTAIPPHIDASAYARECLEAAVFCRLPPYNLDHSEHQLLRTHINHVQVTTYLNVRNGILRLWMLNPTIAVCREEALGVAKEERHLEMAAKCHEFLVRHGYINFGCILPPRPLSRPAEEARKEKSLRRRKRVVIVGAGAAGLGCARQLEGLFVQFADHFPRNDELPEVIVLEGRDRIGGRIHSHPLASPSVPERPRSAVEFNSKSSALSSASSMSRVSTSSFATTSLSRVADPAVDLGAQIVTGFDNGNPLAPIIKRQLHLRWHNVHDDSLLFNDQDGVHVNRMEDIRAEKLFNYILDRASAFKEKIKDPPLIEGDRELMDQGKEPHGESGRQIAKVEENEAVLPPMPPSPPLSVTRDSPFSNRPSPKPHSQKPRIPARRALERMGFKLKDGKFKENSLDPNELSNHTTLGDTMKSILLDVQRFVDLSPMDLKLLNWHWANLEYGNATNLNRLSLKHWDQDDGNEFLGAHAMIIGGYGQLTSGLASTPTMLDIRYNQCVEKITYSRSQNRRTPECDEPPVKILCHDGQSFQADAVVLTPSLGVLKSGSITFDPELPVHKRDTISRLGFGLLNKVVLVYEHPFWDSEADVIGSLRTPEEDPGVQDSYEHRRGRFYLIWNCTSSCGRPTLVALMAGDAAFEVENEQDESLMNEMTSILARIYNKESLPQPIQYFVSRWHQDPFACGSYSFVGPDATGKDYDILGESVDQKLFFAGEATCRTHPATVHGAYMSGLRAATEVLESFIGKIEMPPDEVLIPKKYQPVRNPLVEKSCAPQVKRRTDPESRRFKARNIRRSRFAKIVEECSQRILTELGPKPVPPKKYHPNAFLVFQRDKWEIAKSKANQAKAGNHSDGGESASRDEVRAAMGRMWRDLPDDEKRRYNEAVEKEKLQYKEEVATFGRRVEAWESAVAKIKEEMKGKLDEVDLTEEEREIILAAREEERLEIAANEEKEKLKQFFCEIGMDDLFPDEEEEQIEDPYLQSDDAVLDQLLRRLG